MFSEQGFHALRKIESNIRTNDSSQQFKNQLSSSDTLVLFGELFARGYANGLVEAAEKKGMQIIYSTVGRRDKDQTLRCLNSDELSMARKPLINIPLEAGFDMSPAQDNLSPIDRTQDIKLSDWQKFQVDDDKLKESQLNGRERFRQAVKDYTKELKKLNPPGNIYFAHLMAGGVPRTKIIMPLMNRSVKGTGDRFLSSETFWSSDLGKICQLNFLEVTSETFRILIEETEELRDIKEKQGHFVCYSAYGYHGTEIFDGTKYDWQTYTPYLQGWAKIALENNAKYFFQKGIKACVYNCPEILTNSSSIFQGVEIPLYPLLMAFEHEGGKQSSTTQNLFNSCQEKLKDPYTLEDVLSICKQILNDPDFRNHCNFKMWPQHNDQALLEKILTASEKIIELHKDRKDLMTNILSEIVFASCGQLMLSDIANPQSAVSWIGHDVIAKQTLLNAN